MKTCLLTIRNFSLLLFLFAIPCVVVSQDVWINEIHYDNDGADVNEGVELAGTAGVWLENWKILAYNGNGGGVYDSVVIGQVFIPDLENSFGTVWFNGFNSLQNGSPDGVALVDNTGSLIQFLSYEGTLTGTESAANGVLSIDIGVSETTATTPVDYSLQLSGTGKSYADFTWQAPATHTRDTINTGQVFTKITDTSPPVFNTGYPKADDLQETRFDIVVNLDELGTVYYLVQDHGQAAPDLATVRQGDTLDIFIFNKDFSTTIDGLSPGTTYDVYFLAEDDEDTPNVQAATTLLEVTTPMRVLDFTYPAGGETFYPGDSLEITWTSQDIDSLDLFVYMPNFDLWGTFEAVDHIDATPGKFKFQLPPALTYDSTRLLLADYMDESFNDTSGYFYLVDTVNPALDGFAPVNKSTEVPRNIALEFAFNEFTVINDGCIRIFNTDGTLYDTVHVASEYVTNFFDVTYTVTPTKWFMPDSSYYVLIDPGAFVDYQGNLFPGITSDTVWTFSIMGNDLFFSEYCEGGSNRKALEIYNPTEEIVSLDEYRIAQSNNGTGWLYYHNFPGGSTLGPGEFWVILTDDPTFTDTTYFDPANADEVLSYPSVVHHNGNDARAIEKNIQGEWVIIDQIGDPNSADNFDVAGITGAAKDHTLLRKDFIRIGNPDWYASAGTNAFDSEWKVLEKDNFDNLGMMSIPSNNQAEILEFTLAEQTGPAVIDSAAATVDIEVVLGTKLDSLFPVVVVSDAAFVDPASGDSVDFSGGSVEYIVVAEDRVTAKIWTVTVTEYQIPSSENDILTFVLTEETKTAEINIANHTVTAEVEYRTSLTALVPTITVSAAATIDPASGVEQDFTSPVTYTVTAQDATPQDWEVTVTVQQPNQVATIADLRAGTVDNKTLYELTGEVVLTNFITYRSKKYVQDATGGIEIDDDPGNITTAYAIGDGISGLVGTLEEYGGLLQLHPVTDPGPAITTGNVIIPEVVSVADFKANHNDYECELVQITGVTFTAEGETFENGIDYEILQGAETTACRTHFYDVDYIGTTIPSGLQDITGIALEYNGKAQLAPRFAADIASAALSSEKDILTFTLTEQTGDATINATTFTVDIEVENGTDVTSLSPVITVSTDATISPESGVAQDFTDPVTYTVTAEDGTTQDWTVIVTIATSVNKVGSHLIHIYPNPSAGIFSFSLETDHPESFVMSILNLNGQVMLTKNYEAVHVIHDVLDLSGYNPGIYLIRLQSGSDVLYEKLIIE